MTKDDKRTIAQDDPTVKPVGKGEFCPVAAAPSLNPQLEAANRLLLARRAALGVRPTAASAAPAAAVATAAWPDPAALPGHLGWGSAALTRCLARAAAAVAPHVAARPSVPQPETTPAAACAAASEWAAPAPAPVADVILIDPALALAILRHNRAAVGRLWLLLRHSDAPGRGWIARAEAQAHFSAPGAPRRICGRRQLDQLLRQGEGTFWRCRDGRIWLRSLLRVAQTLGVARLTDRPVETPATLLTGGMRQARAALYATFHAGRPQPGAPIARETLRALSGVSPRAQRQYDRAVGVARVANFAVGGPATPEATVEFAHRHGAAAFLLTDVEGRRGAPGRRYAARQLPNSYTAPFASRPRSRRRAVNRRLRQGLAQHGAQGNGHTRIARRYHTGGQTVRSGGYLRDYTIGRAAFWIPLPDGAG